MLVDLTLEITKEILERAGEDAKKGLAGHLGTHFDAMRKTFPLDYAIRKGIVIDVSSSIGEDGEIKDVDLNGVEEGMFVAFRTGFITRVPYTDKAYHREHPYLSYDIIDRLLEKKVSIIGIDASGIRRGSEHTPTDQKCADRGTFVVENLVNLSSVLQGREKGSCIFYTFPLSSNVYTGLPTRVLAQI